MLSAESWGDRILWLELMAGFLVAIGRALSLECPTLRNYIERNTEINLDRIALKRLRQTPWKQKINIQQEKVGRFYYFLPLFWTIPYDRSLLRNVMLTVPRELGLSGCGVCFPKSCINEIRCFKSTTKKFHWLEFCWSRKWKNLMYIIKLWTILFHKSLRYEVLRDRGVVATRQQITVTVLNPQEMFH